MATDAAVLERPETIEQLPDDIEEYRVCSYKCEDCGKIIAAPSSNPTPHCCGAVMRIIR